MKVLAWITEGGWEACVDAAAALEAQQVTLLHVAAVDLPGPRGRRYEDVLARMGALAGEAAAGIARGRRGAARQRRVKRAESGQPETIVLEAAREADVLVVARDGRHIGPHSFGHELRFVVDHAPCTVVLAWPTGAPEDVRSPKPKPKPKGKPKPKPKPPPEEW